MTPVDISDDVRAFVIQHIDSIGQLEIILLLAQTPEKGWTSRAVSQELRSNDAWVEAHLNKFVSRGILTVQQTEDGRRYQLDREQALLMSVIQKLLSEYQTFRLRIIELIYGKPTDRMQRLADAFRYRKDDKNG